MNTTPRKEPHKKPPLPLKKPKITFWDSMLPEDSKEEAVALTVMQELTSRELGDEEEEEEKEILEVLKLHLNDYKKIPENEQDPEFKKNLEKDITIFQNYVNNQSGGKRRKKKTRKKRGGLDSFPIGMLDQLSQDTVYNNPHKDDLIRRLNHIWNILGEDEEDEDAQEAFKDLIRRNPNSFYPLIIHFIQQAEAEHHGGRRKKKKTRKKRGGELKYLSVEELKAALDISLSFHIHLFSQLVDASGEFNYKFRHPNWEPGEPSVEEQLFGKYEDWRYYQMMEHKGIAADYGDEMGQYIANAPIDELNGTMDFYCENWKSALGERLKNSILNFKKKNKEKIQEINFEHLFEYDKIAKEYKKLEKLYLEFIDRIKEIYEVYKEKKKDEGCRRKK